MNYTYLWLYDDGTTTNWDEWDQRNFDNYMIGCIVGFLNMNNVGEFVHNPTEETVMIMLRVIT